MRTGGRPAGGVCHGDPARTAARVLAPDGTTGSLSGSHPLLLLLSAPHAQDTPPAAYLLRCVCASSWLNSSLLL